MMKVLFCIFLFYLSTCSDVCFAGPGPGPDPIRQIIKLVPKSIQLVPKVLRYPEVISEVSVIQNDVGGPVLLSPPSSPLPSSPTPPPSPTPSPEFSAVYVTKPTVDMFVDEIELLTGLQHTGLRPTLTSVASRRGKVERQQGISQLKRLVGTGVWKEATANVRQRCQTHNTVQSVVQAFQFEYSDEEEEEEEVRQVNQAQVRQYFLDRNALLLPQQQHMQPDDPAVAPAFSAVDVVSPITTPLSSPVLQATPVVASAPSHVDSLGSPHSLEDNIEQYPAPLPKSNTAELSQDKIVESVDTLPKSNTSELSQDEIVESVDTLPKSNTSEFSQDKIVESLDTLPKSNTSELSQDKIEESETYFVPESAPIEYAGSPHSEAFFDQTPIAVLETEPEP